MPDRRPPPPPDPYEYGFDVTRRQRLPIPDLEPPTRPGQRLRRPPRDVWKFALAGIAVVVAIAVGRSVQAEHTNALKPDCSRTQVKVAESSVVSRGAQLMHWTATARAGTRYVVAVNASTVTLAGDVATATPAHGAAGQASRLQTMGKNCLGRGLFGVLLPPGTYAVTLFRIDGAAATAVGETRVRVTAS